MIKKISLAVVIVSILFYFGVVFQNTPQTFDQLPNNWRMIHTYNKPSGATFEVDFINHWLEKKNKVKCCCGILQN